MLSEKDEDASDANGNLDETITDAEKAAAGDKKKDDYPLSQQLIDQERANAARARERAAGAEANLASAKAENQKLQQQLEEATTKATAAGIEDVTLDESQYEGTDLQLVKAIKSLNKKLEVSNAENVRLAKLAKQYEVNEAQKAATQQRNTAYEELLDELDKDYGTDCRNEAVTKFNQLAGEGKVPKGNPTKATRMMERCYREVKAAKSKKTDKKNPLSLDRGSGGGARTNLTGMPLKKGSLDEVAAQAAQLVASKAS